MISSMRLLKVQRKKKKKSKNWCDAGFFPSFFLSSAQSPTANMCFVKLAITICGNLKDVPGSTRFPPFFFTLTCIAFELNTEKKNVETSSIWCYWTIIIISSVNSHHITKKDNIICNCYYLRRHYTDGYDELTQPQQW